jgi:hypothetical protein
MIVKDGMTGMIGMPEIEAYNVIDAMEAAEKAGNLSALQWCARRIVWLYEQGETYSGDMFCNAEKLFNDTYAEILKRDPPPEIIAAIIARGNQGAEPEPPDAADASEALNTLRIFFEESLGGKSYKAILTSLDALKQAVEKAEAWE